MMRTTNLEQGVGQPIFGNFEMSVAANHPVPDLAEPIENEENVI
jgi:hypothetical protein